MRQVLAAVRAMGCVGFALSLVAAPAAAAAAEEPASLAAAFDNTIVSTYDNGRIAKLWLDPDGRYRGLGKSGDASSGHWTIKRDKVCLKQDKPLPVPFSYCTLIPEGGVGAVWIAKSVFGEALSVELVNGR
ncbi:MAG: hypothetical protein KXJ53_12830 [Phenylobacterium sp.]|jgi:hypothetical protein|nr:hypothetical protein [Phenylobacterium sp.]